MKGAYHDEGKRNAEDWISIARAMGEKKLTTNTRRVTMPTRQSLQRIVKRPTVVRTTASYSTSFAFISSWQIFSFSCETSNDEDSVTHLVEAAPPSSSTTTATYYTLSTRVTGKVSCVRATGAISTLWGVSGEEPRLILNISALVQRCRYKCSSFAHVSTEDPYHIPCGN